MVHNLLRNNHFYLQNGVLLKLISFFPTQPYFAQRRNILPAWLTTRVFHIRSRSALNLKKLWKKRFSFHAAMEVPDFFQFFFQPDKTSFASLQREKIPLHWRKKGVMVDFNKGSPSQGSEHSRMFRRHFAEVTFPSTLRYKPVSEPVFKNLRPG